MIERSIKSENFGKEKLFKLLAEYKIEINDYARIIFNSPGYKFKSSVEWINIVELSLNKLGLQNGGRFSDIERAMKSNGLDYCPLEFAPYIRLAYVMQSISHKKSNNQHPPDALLIFSKPITQSEDFPKGFYIRNIDGTLWLRGYVCSEDYHWNTDNRIILRNQNK